MKTLLVVIGLSCTVLSCGSPISSDEATDLLVSQLWEEDSLVQATCRELEADQPETMGSMLDGEGLSLTGRREILRQDVANVEALYRVLDIDMELCPVEPIITGLLPVSSSSEHADIVFIEGLSREGFDVERCHEHLESLYTALAETGSDNLRRARVFQALSGAGLTASDLLYRPFEAARLIDLSPAVVFTVIYFADRMNELTRDLASSFGFASGLVELLILEVAAEILAISVEGILVELEAAGAVSRASVARRACELYESGTSRPNTTVRLLKRMILRFSLVPYSGPATSYAATAFCRRLSDASVCEEMLEELELEQLIEDAPDDSVEFRYDELVPRLHERTSEYWNDAPEWQSYLLLDASLSCGDPCTLEQLNQAASMTMVAWFAGSHPDDLSAFPVLVAPTLWTPDGQTQREIQALREELTAARNTTSALVNLFLVGESSTGRLRHEVIETVGRLSDCHIELDRVRESRLAFANGILVVDPPLSCDGPNRLHQSTRFLGVRIPSSMACDPSQPFDFDIGTDGLFDTCEDDPLEAGRAMLEALAFNLASLEPEAVVIIGHADQRPVETAECLAHFENNTLLSEARAETVRQLLALAFDERLLTPIPFYTTGVGDIAPRVHCGSDAEDDCHANNRRVALRLVGARGLDFDFSCVGGN